MSTGTATSKLRENTGTTSGNLRGMEIGKENGELSPYPDGLRVRSLSIQITNSKSGINAPFQFKNEQREDGVFIWRTA